MSSFKMNASFEKERIYEGRHIDISVDLDVAEQILNRVLIPGAVECALPVDKANVSRMHELTSLAKALDKAIADYNDELTKVAEAITAGIDLEKAAEEAASDWEKSLAELNQAMEEV